MHLSNQLISANHILYERNFGRTEIFFPLFGLFSISLAVAGTLIKCILTNIYVYIRSKLLKLKLTFIRTQLWWSKFMRLQYLIVDVLECMWQRFKSVRHTFIYVYFMVQWILSKSFQTDSIVFISEIHIDFATNLWNSNAQNWFSKYGRKVMFSSKANHHEFIYTIPFWKVASTLACSLFYIDVTDFYQRMRDAAEQKWKSVYTSHNWWRKSATKG